MYRGTSPSSMLASRFFINWIRINAKQGSWVIFRALWICWCFDDPGTQKLPLRSVPACAGVIQTRRRSDTCWKSKQESEWKQTVKIHQGLAWQSWAWRALGRAPSSFPASPVEICTNLSWQQSWDLFPNSCYELNTMQRLWLAGQQNPNPGHRDVEGEEKKMIKFSL